MADFSELETAYQRFPDTVQSLMLSTVDTDGWPQASYAPFVRGRNGSFYVFVSGLSAHTQNLQTTPRAGILFIQDEASTQQIFARRRLMYQCTVQPLDRQQPDWSAIVDQFEARFGNIIDMLRQLPDFQIFQLQPQSGRFVVGFGAAYEVDRNNLSRLLPNQ